MTKTMMTMIETIRAEIERLKEIAKAERVLHPHTILAAKNFLLIQDYDNLLSFLDTLESEKPMNQDGLEKEYEDYVVKDPCFSKLVNRNAGLVVARHFFDLGCRRTAEKYDEIEYNRQRAEEHLATSGKTISVKPGDEVAINGHKIVYYKDKGYVTIVKSEESVPNDLEEMADKYEQEFFTDATLGEAFIAGAEWDREQMMKEAVEYEVWDFTSSLDACPSVNIPLDNKHYRSGDKVRVIVLPKGCEK